MWTEITRPKYERAGRRYASDLADAEWRLIEPYMPAVKRLGRPRETDLRAIVDAILYIARTGCQWRLLPKDFPPFTTVQGYFYDWRDGLAQSKPSTGKGLRDLNQQRQNLDLYRFHTASHQEIGGRIVQPTRF